MPVFIHQTIFVIPFIDYLDYWLNCIHTHATSREFNPTAITLSPPVIIVGTHKDEIEKASYYYGIVYNYPVLENCEGKD